MKKEHDIRVVERHAHGILNDLVFIECDGVTFKGLYDCRYFNDQIVELFRKDYLTDENETVVRVAANERKKHERNRERKK